MSTYQINPQDRRAFFDLAMLLEPESLYQDGERSHKEAEREAMRIWGQWRVMERKVGRKVSLEEAWGWWEPPRPTVSAEG